MQYSHPEEAKAAMLALNGVYSFEDYPGNEAPMVVEWMDPSKLTPQAQQVGSVEMALSQLCESSQYTLRQF